MEHKRAYKAADGLLYCKICNKPMQTIIKSRYIPETVVNCLCECEAAEREKEKERMRQVDLRNKKKISIGKEEPHCFSDNTDIESRYSLVIKSYAENFDDYLERGKGLILYGTKGTGKTFFAECVADKLIEDGYSVAMLNFSTIYNALWEAENKQEYLDKLLKKDLLIIDDLGSERQSEHMTEIVFQIIDGRVSKGKPLLVTTNVNIGEMAREESVAKGRIYDRLLEGCYPIGFDGDNTRLKKAREDYIAMKKELEGKCG